MKQKCFEKQVRTIINVCWICWHFLEEQYGFHKRIEFNQHVNIQLSLILVVISVIHFSQIQTRSNKTWKNVTSIQQLCEIV